ncbi:MAG: hypothetical protein HRT66_08525 [Flavobacteriaceae bacterium]|nr:hypothetical protein [Flavobacteriaceae bacterium]
MKHLKSVLLLSMLLLFSYCDEDSDSLSSEEKTKAELIKINEALESKEYKEQTNGNSKPEISAKKSRKLMVRKLAGRTDEDCVLSETFQDTYEGYTYDFSYKETDKNWVTLEDCSSRIPYIVEVDDRLGTIVIVEGYHIWTGSYVKEGSKPKESYNDKGHYIFKIEIGDRTIKEAAADFESTPETLNLSVYLNYIVEETYSMEDQGVTVILSYIEEGLEEYIDGVRYESPSAEKYDLIITVDNTEYKSVINEKDLITEEEDSSSDTRILVATAKLYKSEIHVGYVSMYDSYGNITFSLLDMDKNELE